MFGHKQGGTAAFQNCRHTWAERAVMKHLLETREIELKEEGHAGPNCGHYGRGTAKCDQRGWARDNCS